MEMNNDIFTPDLPMRPFLPLSKKKRPLRLPRPAADARPMPRY